MHVFDADRPVPGGHYRPVHRPLAQIEALAATQGVGHLVLVQPSVYGCDNRVLLAALAVEPGRHRGVAVVDDDVDDATLDALHAAGVRGLRLNLVSPVGERAAASQADLEQHAEARFRALAPRLRARGWHLQWYLRPPQLPRVAELHRGSGVVCVLDHLAGLPAGLPATDPAWPALADLAAQGAWLKLSGWYRLAAQPPYAVALAPQIQRAAALFGERLVWGSDWPHTAFAPEAMPSYESTWQPVAEVLGRAAAERLRDRCPAIYA